MKNVIGNLMFFLFTLTSNFILAQSIEDIPPKLKHTIEKSIQYKNPILIGEYFIRRPYKANRLSPSNPEKIYFSFSDFDCVTYVENILALYFSGGSTDKFIDNLIKIRYNDSISYENRNHYLTSGLDKLVQMNFLIPINNSTNSKSIQKNICFISQNTTSNQIDLLKLKKIEATISRKFFYYFDSIQKSNFINGLKNGDVIAFVATRNDLDFKHVGFVYIKNNKKYILHASQEKKNVCISDLTIDEYLLKNRKIKGFQIYRPTI
jgi:hypothetical protein